MRKLLLLGAALALCAAPAFAAVPSAPQAHGNSHIVQAAVKKHVKKSGKKSQKKGKHSKKAKTSAVSKPAPEAGNTAAGESLPPVTDTSGGPQ